MVGEVSTRPAASYKMDGWSREKSTPRSRTTPVGSSIVSPMGQSNRCSRGVRGSESVEVLVKARTPTNSDEESLADAGRVWRNSDGVEFVMAMPADPDVHSSSEKTSMP
jgi:hypothetical protein